MKSIMDLERDTDNSDPGTVEIASVETARGQFVSIKLGGPEREVWIDRDRLLRAIDWLTR